MGSNGGSFQLRDWSEFLQGPVEVPAGAKAIKERLGANVSHYAANYGIVCGALFLLAALLFGGKPFVVCTALTALLCAAAWFGANAYNQPQMRALLAVGCAALFGMLTFWYTQTGAVALWTLGIIALFVLGHGTLHKPSVGARVSQGLHKLKTSVSAAAK